LNALGRSRGGVSTKIHVLSDANGLPLALHLTPGQTADISAAPDLIALGQTRPRELLADKGCGRRRPARGAISARRAPHYSVEVEPQNARHARPSPLCQAKLHRAHDGLLEAVSPRRHPLRQDRRKLPQLRATRSHPSLDALCPHGLKDLMSAIIAQQFARVPRGPTLARERVRCMCHSLRQSPLRNCSPDPATAGLFRYIRRLCGRGCSPAPAQ
jgi:hypothetical protein